MLEQDVQVFCLVGPGVSSIDGVVVSIAVVVFCSAVPSFPVDSLTSSGMSTLPRSNPDAVLLLRSRYPHGFKKAALDGVINHF